MRFPERFNKPMGNLWLSITDSCNLRCKYCFVPKGNLKLNFDEVRPVIDFFMNAPGKQKRIDYYGGEPLINVELLEQSIPYAIELGKSMGKDVRTYISTNATLYSPKMTFLKECNVHMLISIDGNEESHNFNRMYGSGRGSWKDTVKGLRLMQQELAPHNICALFTVSPELAHKMIENFEALLDLGFRCVNIEAERTQRWRAESIHIFVKNLELIANRILSSIELEKDSWLFLNFFSRRVATFLGHADTPSGCPFEENFIVYPDGSLSTPPTIVFEDMKEHFLVGDIHNGLFPFYENCSFDPQSPHCAGCLKRAEQLELLRDHGVQKERNVILDRFVDRLISMAQTNERAMEYLRESDKWTYV